MSDDAVSKLLSTYTPEQLARAYLKASARAKVAEEQAKLERTKRIVAERLGSMAQRFGL